MINNATQLKAKVRNLSKGDDKIAKAYIRIFFMERFMERLSISEYRDKFRSATRLWRKGVRKVTGWLQTCKSSSGCRLRY